MSRHALVPAGGAEPGTTAQPAETGGHVRRCAERGHVIVLSYAYSGAQHVQHILAAGTGLACTSGTGIIPLCAAVAETWQAIEDKGGQAMSRLAASTIQALVTVQVTSILARSGTTRWCELATAPPGAAQAFLQVFPGTGFVCVHRSCLGVVRAGVQASPWGLHGQGLVPYILSYPGNSVAALAAYWANSAQQLLAFEAANGEAAHRVRYEDVIAQPEALTAVRASLGLGNDVHNGALPGLGFPEPDTALQGPEAEVPAEMIPQPLRQRISTLHAELGYPPLE
jgi:hypothetical protein